MPLRLSTPSTSFNDQTGAPGYGESFSTDSALESAAASSNPPTLPFFPPRPCAGQEDAMLEQSMTAGPFPTAFPGAIPHCRSVEDAALEQSMTATAISTISTNPFCRSVEDSALELASADTAPPTTPRVVYGNCAVEDDANLENSVSASAQPTRYGWPNCLTGTDSALERSVADTALRTFGPNTFMPCISAGDAELENSLSASAQPTRYGWPNCLTGTDSGLERSVTDVAMPTQRGPYMPCISAGDAELENSVSASPQPTRFGWPGCIMGTDSALERSVAMAAPVTTPWSAFPRQCVGSEDANLEASATATAMRTAMMPPCFNADVALEQSMTSAATQTTVLGLPRCSSVDDIALEHSAADTAIGTFHNPRMPQCMAIDDAKLENSASASQPATGFGRPLCPFGTDSGLEQSMTAGPVPTSLALPICRMVEDAALEFASADMAPPTRPWVAYGNCAVEDDAKLENSASASQPATGFGRPLCPFGTDSGLEQSMTSAATQTTVLGFPRCSSVDDIALEHSAADTAIGTFHNPRMPQCMAAGDAKPEYRLSASAQPPHTDWPCLTEDDAALERITLNAAPSVNPYVVHCAAEDAALEQSIMKSAPPTSPMSLMPCLPRVDDAVLEGAAVMSAGSTHMPPQVWMPCISADGGVLERVAASNSPMPQL
ncbi:hypothetical protein [Ferrovibrio sp.]|uniref:hypothetical protein n=1 Tax=Ferrovibrio sp. TaxID=1917215 RepID=UPI001B69EB84|nr:hypothetical protein [Ferrovibrio sp.]MBP7063495.1 hypothetical protein [Ferrovibrio sp.]